MAQLVKCLHLKHEDKPHTQARLGRRRQADTWGSLASQFSLLGELQANERLLFNNGGCHLRKDDP